MYLGEISLLLKTSIYLQTTLAAVTDLAEELKNIKCRVFSDYFASEHIWTVMKNITVVAIMAR
jgi:hypothetical protein